jgi:YaiO family outer membrane protein
MTRRFLTGLLLLATATPTFADEPSSTYTRARQLDQDGRHADALVLFDTLHSEYPENVDYLFARALVLSRLGRDGEALDDLRIASGLAPSYEDVWRLRYALLVQQQDAGFAEERTEVRSESSARFPLAPWLQVAEEEPGDPWLVTVGAGYDSLSNGYPSWNNQFVEARFLPDADKSVHVRLGRDERAAAADTSMGLGGEINISSDWFAGAEVVVANDPFYLADFAFSVHAGKALADGWVVDLRYQKKEYANATVGSAIGMIEKYYGDFRFAYVLNWSRLHGASNFASHIGTLNWYYNERGSVGVAVNTGKEAEPIGNGQVLETSVRGISLTGRRDMGDRFTLHWWLGLHDQGDFYRRQFLGMAVSIRI